MLNRTMLTDLSKKLSKVSGYFKLKTQDLWITFGLLIFLMLTLKKVNY